MTALLLAAAVAVTALPRITGIVGDTVEGRPAVRIVTSSRPEVVVKREPESLTFSVGATADASLTPPAGPVRVGVARQSRATDLSFRLASNDPYYVLQDDTTLTIVFGAAGPGGAAVTPVAPASAGARPDVQSLYPKLFPPQAESPLTAPEEETTSAEDNERREPGLWLGPLRLRPALVISYVQSDAFLADGPAPVEDRYWEVQPRLGTELSLLDGRFKADYEPRFRGFSAYPRLNGEPSHQANARLELPLSRGVIRLSDHYARGLLEVSEVDAGREYFFELGRFWRNRAEGDVSWELGPRVSLVAGGFHNRVRFEEPSGFFDYDTQGLRAGLEYAIHSEASLQLTYGYDEVVAPPARPQVAANARTASAALAGELLPLVRGTLSVGYRDLESPKAGAGGERFRGVVGTGEVTKEFTRGARLTLGGSRGTYPSSFEENAFYVGTGGLVRVSLIAPLSLALSAGAAYQRNEYRVPSAALDGKRRDDLRGWSVGIGRAFGTWAFLRADYSRERRDSSLDALDNETEMLSIQLGLGMFGTAR